VAQLVAAQGHGALPRGVAADIAAGFQAAVADIFVDRMSHALDMCPAATALVVAGGVAANQTIRARLMEVAAAAGKRFLAPPLRLCTDNAVMVAWAGIERLRLGMVTGLDAACRPRWPL
jgi:N6-L-threonylcarbamoyladenine synthase